MSKSRNSKWYDRDDEYESYKNKKNKFKDRRNEKRMKSALKIRDIDYLSKETEEY